ncbi:MAG TPA: heme-binding protein [Burkholderiales bacterium]|nr:heme-binding protein [Betaproteobacteria bacterium]HQR53757.1 heme-binding protein [Burkholderiales bacterium]
MQKRVLSLAEAQKMTAAAEARALEEGWPVAIAVVDDGGHLICLTRLDGTQLGSIDVAIEKARSAVLFKRPTKSWEERLAEGKFGYLNLPRLVPVEGGIPVILDNQIVGGIGVSGVRSGEDAMVAQAGLIALIG